MASESPNQNRSAAEIDREAHERGVVFARFFMMNDDFEARERETVRVDRSGGMARVIERCSDYGEQADLLDVAGFVVGTVYCDGLLDWWV